MMRPKVEAPLYPEALPRREKKITTVSKVADEYFIRKPDFSALFPKPNRCETILSSQCVCRWSVLLLFSIEEFFLKDDRKYQMEQLNMQ